MTVNRWHANPDPIIRNSGDTIDAHHWRVYSHGSEIAARIRLSLVGSALTNAFMHHDAAEEVMGDWPGPYCRLPHVAAFKAAEEDRIHRELSTPGWPWSLSAVEASVMELADKADAWLWVAGLRRHETQDFPALRVQCYWLADIIGPGALVWWADKTQGLT